MRFLIGEALWREQGTLAHTLDSFNALSHLHDIHVEHCLREMF